MAEPVHPDVVVNICHSLLPEGEHLSRQWKQDGLRVLVREVPCSGKVDGQYLLHALEGATRGLCVVACPRGTCRLAQGNYRAEIRIKTVRRLLREIGIEPERVEIVHGARETGPEALERLVREAVSRIGALGPGPLGAEGRERNREGGAREGPKAIPEVI